MLEIKLSDGSVCTPIECLLYQVEDHVRKQREVCQLTGIFLVEPLRVVSFTYTFK